MGGGVILRGRVYGTLGRSAVCHSHEWGRLGITRQDTISNDRFFCIGPFGYGMCLSAMRSYELVRISRVLSAVQATNRLDGPRNQQRCDLPLDVNLHLDGARKFEIYGCSSAYCHLYRYLEYRRRGQRQSSIHTHP